MGVDFDGDYYETDDLLSDGGWNARYTNNSLQPQRILRNWVDAAARDGYADIEDLYIDIDDRLDDQQQDIDDGYLDASKAASSDEIYEELLETKSAEFADRHILTLSLDEAAAIWTEAGCYFMRQPDIGIDIRKVVDENDYYGGLFVPYLYEFLTNLYYSLDTIYRRQRL